MNGVPVNGKDNFIRTRYLSSKEIQKKWFLVDVKGSILGRSASFIANILRGKNKPSYTPFLDCGDNVVVINCSLIKLTGKKSENKEYIRYTGYPGGQRIKFFKDMIKNDSVKIMLHAIKGMLPKNRLGRKILKNVRCFAGSEHTLSSQNPEEIKIK